jgi:hypothetical protein
VADFWGVDAPGEPDPEDHATVREVVERLGEEGFTIEFELDKLVPWNGASVALVHVASGERWRGFGTGKTGASAAVDALQRFARLAAKLREPVVKAPRLRPVVDPEAEQA